MWHYISEFILSMFVGVTVLIASVAITLVVLLLMHKFPIIAAFVMFLAFGSVIGYWIRP